jgi:hypothetical protein
MLRNRAYGTPIKLSKVASQFSINPTPIFDTSVSEGRLTYSKDERQFLITLGAPPLIAKKRPSADQLFDGKSTRDDPSMTRRLRFTYAHELAHRFCFVERTGSWIRALDLAVERKQPAAKLNDLLRLSKNEERLCNRVAGRLLVPDELLADHLGEASRGCEHDIVAAFYKVVDRAAARFAVTFDCMFVQLQRAFDRRIITLPDGFCAILVGETSKIGSDHLADRRPRVRVALLPKILGKSRLEALFPGLATDKLGDDVRALVSKVAAGEDTCGNVDCSLLLRTSERKYSELTPRLRGWWHLIGGKKRPESIRILLWGLLRG